MQNQTDYIASTHLGKKITPQNSYDPSLLVAVPRYENRAQYNIDNTNLPFDGWDVWHGYEFSCLTENGIPVTRLLKLKYRCTSDYIVESKSLKLYLNSFNMTHNGCSTADCLKICKSIIKNDLQKILNTEVIIDFIDNYTEKREIFSNFNNIAVYIDEKNITIQNFKEAPNLLETEDSQARNKYHFLFDSLRSNCRVTHQPDFGDVFIYYNSNKHIKEESLFKYLCSFRTEFHFHEECCEMIFKRLYDILEPEDELFVCALYTRRGGIDINPVRWTKNFNSNYAQELLDTTSYARCGIRQ